MKKNIQIEVCLGNVQDVKTIESYPEIDRIEFNSALELDGLTPSFSSFIEARKASSKKIIAMSRVRGGDFCYTNDEFEVMMKDARIFLENGADGIVFGFLNEHHRIHDRWISQMVDLIHFYNKEAIFHKAFDIAKDMDDSIQRLIEWNVDRILTSGQKENVIAGLDNLAYLQKRYGKDIEILPGGGVRADNVNLLIERSGCTQIHTSAKKSNPTKGYTLDEIALKDLLQQLD